MSRTAGLKHLLPRVLGIVGAGQLGTGVAELAARHGFERIIVHDAQESLTRRLRRAVASGPAAQNEHVNSPHARLEFTSRLDELDTADFVIEAVHEDEILKKDVFRQLDRNQRGAFLEDQRHEMDRLASLVNLCRPCDLTQWQLMHVPELMPASKIEQIGMHFMNPPVVTDMLEIVGGKATSASVYERAQVLALHLNKTVCFSLDRPMERSCVSADSVVYIAPAEFLLMLGQCCWRDRHGTTTGSLPIELGFIVNRILMPMINEAFFALMEGVASAEDIDLAMKKGTHQHMGPLHLADYIGLDTCLNIMRVLHSGIGEDKYRPCPMLVQLVDAGWLGVKSGRGVFIYPNGRHTSAVTPGVSPPAL